MHLRNSVRQHRWRKPFWGVGRGGCRFGDQCLEQISPNCPPKCKIIAICKSSQQNLNLQTMKQLNKGSLTKKKISPDFFS
jgi:hypothetical protein